MIQWIACADAFHILMDAKTLVDGAAAYVKWRLVIILIYRALLAHNLVVLFYISSAKREQPVTWIVAILKITILMSRVMMPSLQFLSFQVISADAGLLRRKWLVMFEDLNPHVTCCDAEPPVFKLPGKYCWCWFVGSVEGL